MKCSSIYLVLLLTFFSFSIRSSIFALSSSNTSNSSFFAATISFIVCNSDFDTTCETIGIAGRASHRKSVG